MRLKNEKGSITIFVLVGLLFMSAFLIISYSNNLNKSKVVKEQLNIINNVYYKGNDSQSYEDAYYNFIKKNKRLITATVENKNNIEIKNSSKKQRCNYGIWGNTIPDTTNPIELKHVGDKVNLLDINNPKYTANNTTSINYVGKIENGVLYNAGKHGSADGACIYIEKPEGAQYLTLSFEAGDEAPEQATTGYVYKFYYFNELDETTGIPTDLYRGAVSYYIKGHNKYTTIDCSSYKYIGFTTCALSKYEVSFRNIQLEVGGEATEYVPYEKYRIPIKISGENTANLYACNFPEESILRSIAGETANYMAVGAQNRLVLEPSKQYVIKFDYEVLENTDVNYYVGNAIGKNPNAISYSAFTETYKTIYEAGAENIKGTINWVVTARDDRDFEQYAYLTFGVACGNRAYQKVDQNTENTGSIKITNVRLYEYQEGNDYNADDEHLNPKIYNIYIDAPLALEDYINFVSGKVKRADETEENVDLPEISIFEEYTKIEVLTEVAPSKIKVEYLGYDI